MGGGIGMLPEPVRDSEMRQRGQLFEDATCGCGIFKQGEKNPWVLAVEKTLLEFNGKMRTGSETPPHDGITVAKEAEMERLASGRGCDGGADRLGGVSGETGLKLK